MLHIRNHILKKYIPEPGETHVRIPDGVKKLAEASFFGCRQLQSVTVPESVTEMENAIFYGCTSLREVRLPKTHIRYASAVFRDTPWIEALRAEDPLVILGDSLIDGINSRGDVTVPAGVTSIAGRAFKDAEELTSVTVPEGVKEIGARAFFGCSALREVMIAQSVESLAPDAFDNCTALQHLRWVGRVDVYRPRSVQSEETLLSRAFRMVQEKRYDMRMPSTVKTAFLLGVYRETQDPEALAFLCRRGMPVWRPMVKYGDIPMLHSVLQEPQPITPEDTEALLALARRTRQYEVFAMLLRYKMEQGGFEGEEERLML